DDPAWYTAPVWTFFASIETPGITAPVASETVPVRVPRSVCAKPTRAKSNKQAIANKKPVLMTYFSSCGEGTWTNQLDFFSSVPDFIGGESNAAVIDWQSKRGLAGSKIRIFAVFFLLGTAAAALIIKHFSIRTRCVSGMVGYPTESDRIYE